MESDDQPIVVGWDMGGADWSALGVLALTAALAPVELVSEGERQAAVELRRLQANEQQWLDSNDALRGRVRLLEATVAAQRRGMLLGKDREAALVAENAELRSLVAEFTGLLGSIMDNQPEPSAARVSAHNPFNVPLRDPRRMGP